ncbi:MAG TPA: DUF1684 domain-containing protein [Candidatus Limnocylindrales bacterium]|nr:DUF1684 domain-containing protein [Candidatus Limnocylindrales bacterium]
MTTAPDASRPGSPPELPEGDLLALTDWRRRVAELYAEVRRLAGADPLAALERWRAVRSDLYRTHPQSPVPPSERAAFRPLHFDPDPRLRFELPLEADPEAGAAAGRRALPVSAGGEMTFTRIGWLTVPFPEGRRRLAVYWLHGYAGGLFLPFRDATNGRATYGAGRYVLDTAKGADLGGDPARGTLVVDFNFAYQPSCAFDARWACPLAPPENRLDLEVRAGERIA